MTKRKDKEIPPDEQLLLAKAAKRLVLAQPISFANAFHYRHILRQTLLHGLSGMAKTVLEGIIAIYAPQVIEITQGIPANLSFTSNPDKSIKIGSKRMPALLEEEDKLELDWSYMFDDHHNPAAIIDATGFGAMSLYAVINTLDSIIEDRSLFLRRDGLVAIKKVRVILRPNLNALALHDMLKTGIFADDVIVGEAVDDETGVTLQAVTYKTTIQGKVIVVAHVVGRLKLPPGKDAVYLHCTVGKARQWGYSHYFSENEKFEPWGFDMPDDVAETSADVFLNWPGKPSLKVKLAGINVGL